MRDNAFAVARLLCGVIFVHRGRIFASSRHRIGPFSMEAAWGSRWVIETPHETVRAASPDLYKMPLISVVGIQGQNVMQNGLGGGWRRRFLRGFRIWRQVALDLRCRSSGAECYAQWFWGG